jgi:hypothetical protein
MVDLEKIQLRELQLESARALAILGATNYDLSKFNKEANHNSQQWYKTVISAYVTQYGDLPSKVGPGKEIKLILS